MAEHNEEVLDCLGDYNRMKALGVTFQGEPQVNPWGTGVTFEDLYGNKMYMNQEPQTSALAQQYQNGR